MKLQDNSLEISKLSGSIVKEAVTQMKSKKMDVTGGFSSECLLNSPDSLFDLLSVIFKCWLVHGKVTSSILVCTFIPLLKSQLKDATEPDSYRAIAGSSLILQVYF